MSVQILCKPVVIPVARAFTHRACRLSDRKNQTCLILAIGATTGLKTVNLTVYTYDDRFANRYGHRVAYRFANRSSCVNAL